MDIAWSRGASHLPTPSSQVQGHQVFLLRAALILLRVISVQPLSAHGIALIQVQDPVLGVIEIQEAGTAPPPKWMPSLSSSVWSVPCSLLMSASLLRDTLVPPSILLTKMFNGTSPKTNLLGISLTIGHHLDTDPLTTVL